MKAAAAPQRSVLEQLARFFHQDFFVLFSDVQSGYAAYVSNLSPSQRRSLHEELSAFLTSHEGSSERALRRAWLNLGAQAWPTCGSIRAELLNFIAASGEGPKHG